MNIKTHIQSEMGYTEDEYSITVGLAGLDSNQRNEVTIQVSKDLTQQDIDLGHHKIYLNYNGLGGYDLLQGVVFTSSQHPSISICLNERATQDASIFASELIFCFLGAIDSGEIDRLKKVCEIANTLFLSK